MFWPVPFSVGGKSTCILWVPNEHGGTTLSACVRPQFIPGGLRRTLSFLCPPLSFFLDAKVSALGLAKPLDWQIVILLSPYRPFAHWRKVLLVPQ